MTKAINNAARPATTEELAAAQHVNNVRAGKFEPLPTADERMQQARADFAAKKAAEAQAAAAATAQPIPAGEPIITERAASAIGAMMEEFKLPSFTRVICGVILGIVLAAGLGYLLGWVLSALMIGAFSLTGSVFVANVIYVLGMVYTAIKGIKVGVKGAAYVISGRIDETFGGVTGTIGGWFKRQPQVIQVVQAAAPFTGAFTAPVPAAA